MGSKLMAKPVQSHKQAPSVRVPQTIDNPEVDSYCDSDQKKVTSADYHSSKEREDEEVKREVPELTDD